MAPRADAPSGVRDGVSGSVPSLRRERPCWGISSIARGTVHAGCLWSPPASAGDRGHSGRSSARRRRGDPVRHRPRSTPSHRCAAGAAYRRLWTRHEANSDQRRCAQSAAAPQVCDWPLPGVLCRGRAGIRGSGGSDHRYLAEASGASRCLGLLRGGPWTPTSTSLVPGCAGGWRGARRVVVATCRSCASGRCRRCG